MTPPYNAKGDGKTNDTAAIQLALKDCGKTGGTVFLSGRINQKFLIAHIEFSGSNT